MTNPDPNASRDEVDNWFTYHQPFDTQTARYGLLRGQGKELALAIERQCPPSRERSTALTKLREAIMWANAAIACNEQQ